MKGNFVIAILAAAMFLGAVSKADVVVKTKSSAEMGGIMSTQTEATNNIKGDKSYNSTTTQMTGGMAAMLGKGKPKEMIDITRIDKSLLWNLDPEKKSYREQTFDDLKKELAKAQGEGKKQEEPEYTWTVDVKTMDQPQTINGFNCNGVIGTATGISKKNPADSLFITYEVWSAKEVPGAAEVEAYQKNYAKAMGIDEMWAKENMGSMLKQYGSEFADLAIKVSQAGTYPIKTIVTVEGNTATKGDESGKGPGDAMSMMGKMFGKKSNNSDNEKGGRSKTFSFTNEVTSIQQIGVDDSQFEIPAGYKKK